MTVHRSFLFVPGSRPERIEKALASGADAVIVDLEDAVEPGVKDEARGKVADFVRHAGSGANLILRINASATPWFTADCELARHRAFTAAMLPKSENPDEIASLHAQGLSVIPLIETALGYERARDIARAPGVLRLAFGSIDFQLDLGIDGEGEELLVFRSGLVLASRLADLVAPIDGVSAAIGDAAAVQADARRARKLGFGGKLCIHPSQVAPVNAAFSPSAQEEQWARRVVAAVEAAGGKGAIAVDGKMVDRPVLLRAQAVLQQVQAFGSAQSGA